MLRKVIVWSPLYLILTLSPFCSLCLFVSSPREGWCGTPSVSAVWVWHAPVYLKEGGDALPPPSHTGYYSYSRRLYSILYAICYMLPSCTICIVWYMLHSLHSMLYMICHTPLTTSHILIYSICYVVCCIPPYHTLPTGYYILPHPISSRRWDASSIRLRERWAPS